VPHIQVVHSGLIVDFDDTSSRSLPFINIPNELTESIDAQYNNIPIIGRSAPIFGYSFTGARTVSLELMFVAEAPEDIDRNLTAVRFLQSFLYPVYEKASNSMRPPHRVQLVLGTFLNIIGIVTNLSVNWQGPYHLGTSDSATVGTTSQDEKRLLAPTIPMVARIPFTVIETVAVPPDLGQVRKSRGTFGSKSDQEAAGGSLASNLKKGKFI